MYRPLSIGIDARELEGKRTGVGRYLINLLKEWADIAPENHYSLFFMRNIPDDPFLKQECFSNKLVKLPELLRKNLFWEQIYLPIYLKKEKLDLFFSPSYTIPFFIQKRTVVTVHDISYEVNPEWFPRKEAFILKFFTKMGVRKAKAVITVSEFAKKDIIKCYGLDDEKVKVIYEAPDRIFSSITDADNIKDLKERYNIGDRFLLYAGSILNRRPIEILLKAFSKLIKQDEKLRLVIVGENRTWPKKDLHGMIRDLGIKESVVYLDYIPDTELVLLYRTALIFIYLSLYEGFGLPPLEAMASGTPVIVPNLASFPEVVGDSGILLDHVDEDELRNAILKLAGDESLSKNYREKGKEKARGFSWQDSARRHLKIFRDIINDRL